MTIPTFPFAVDTSRLQRAPALRKAKYGDGYQQSAPAGLNSNLRKYSVTISPKKGEDIDLVDAFLSERAGWQPFYWTPPGASTPILVVCESWDVDETNLQVAKSMSATFEERVG